MYLSIIILPLLGSIVSGFFGRKIGVSGAQFITTFSVIMTTILAVLAFFEVGLNNIPVTMELFRWIDSEWFNINWGFNLDSLTVSSVIIYFKNIYLFAVLVIQLYTEILIVPLTLTESHIQVSYIRTRPSASALASSFFLIWKRNSSKLFLSRYLPKLGSCLVLINSYRFFYIADLLLAKLSRPF